LQVRLELIRELAKALIITEKKTTTKWPLPITATVVRGQRGCVAVK